MLPDNIENTEIAEALPDEQDADIYPDDRDAPLFPEAQAAIIFDSVYFHYDTSRFSFDGSPDVLDGVSVDIARGEFVVVIGANGSGKTSFARHINALLVPTQGRVLVVGMDTADPGRLFEIRATAGMVFQNPNAQIVASVVADDVAFGPENLNVQQPELSRRIDLALAAVSMSEVAEDDPAELSGGQRQLISIAGILAMQPEILILDEPGSMLDVQGRAQINHIIRELNERGMTVVLITHFMEEALDADRIIVMDAGKIALDGTPAEVFSHTDELRSFGLDIPFTMLVAEALAGYGLPITSTFDTDSLIEEICSWYWNR